MASPLPLRSAALLAGLVLPAAADDLSPLFKAEVLVEGIAQLDYTDANGGSYVYVDPDAYTNYLAGLVQQPDGTYTLGNLVLNPTDWRLAVPDAYRSSHYEDDNVQMWIRAAMGAKVDILNRAQVELSFVYDAEGGDRTHRGEPGRNLGGVHLNEASVLLPDILPGLGLELGRQDWKLNLRKQHYGFLYDSRANKPTVYGLDGARATYRFEYVTFYPFGFMLDATREETGIQINGDGTTTEVSASKDNYLYGVQAELRPFANGDLQVIGALSWEKNVVVQAANALAGRNEALVGDSLVNYMLGFQWKVDSDLSIFGEGVLQKGELDHDRRFDGLGFTAGATLRIPNYGAGLFRELKLTLQYDFLSGDRRAGGSIYDEMLNGGLIGAQLTPFQKALVAGALPYDPDDRKYRNFVAPMEGVSDMYIVEHERYGELSELLVGNLTAGKAIVEYSSPGSGEVTLRLAGALFALDTPAFDIDSYARQANYFGSEVDASLSWQLTRHTRLTAMGGIFFPGLGYRQVAAAENPAARDIPQDVRSFLTVDRLLNGGDLSPLGTHYDAAYPNLTADDPIVFLGGNVHVVF